jgi:cytochrome P450
MHLLYPANQPLAGHQPKPPHSFLFGHLSLLFKVGKQLPRNTPIGVIISFIQSRYQLPDLFYLDLWPLSESWLVTGDLVVANRFLNDYTRHPMVLEHGLQPLVGGTRGLVSGNISEWHGSRSSIRTVFSVGNVRRFVPDMAQYSMQLRAALLHRASTGRRFPMVEPVEKWGADLTFCFLLGEDTAVQQGGWGAEANAQVQKLIVHADAQLAMNPWTNRQRKISRGRCQERIRQIIRKALEDALKRDEPAAHNDTQFLPLIASLAMKYKEEFPGSTQWDVDTLTQHLDTVATMFLAADVSSMVLTVASPSPCSIYPSRPVQYIFYHIAQDPAVAAELRKEHNSVFPGDVYATLEAIRQNPGKIKELPYTTAVIKESMRLHPPGVSGTTAPKG